MLRRVMMLIVSAWCLPFSAHAVDHKAGRNLVFTNTPEEIRKIIKTKKDFFDYFGRIEPVHACLETCVYEYGFSYDVPESGADGKTYPRSWTKAIRVTTDGSDVVDVEIYGYG